MGWTKKPPGGNGYPGPSITVTGLTFVLLLGSGTVRTVQGQTETGAGSSSWYFLFENAADGPYWWPNTGIASSSKGCFEADCSLDPHLCEDELDLCCSDAQDRRSATTENTLFCPGMSINAGADKVPSCGLTENGAYKDRYTGFLNQGFGNFGSEMECNHFLHVESSSTLTIIILVVAVVCCGAFGFFCMLPAYATLLYSDTVELEDDGSYYIITGPFAVVFQTVEMASNWIFFHYSLHEQGYFATHYADFDAFYDAFLAFCVISTLNWFLAIPSVLPGGRKFRVFMMLVEDIPLTIMVSVYTAEMADIMPDYSDKWAVLSIVCSVISLIWGLGALFSGAEAVLPLSSYI